MRKIVFNVLLAAAFISPGAASAPPSPAFAETEAISCPPPKFEPPVFSGTETLEEKGLAIASSVRNRDAGYGSMFATKATVVTTNVKGEKRFQQLRSFMLEKGEGGAQKALLIFDEPADIEGMVGLIHTFPSKPEEQWFFIPGLQRVKRVSGDNRTSSFLGAEFTNEDLVVNFPLVERYSYKFVSDEPCDGLSCYVIDRFPLYGHSGYKRFRVWIDKSEFRFQKVEFFDRKDELVKTLFFKGYKLYLGHWWRYDSMLMINHHTGKSTEVSNDWNLCAGLTDDDFSINALKRAR